VSAPPGKKRKRKVTPTSKGGRTEKNQKTTKGMGETVPTMMHCGGRTKEGTKPEAAQEKAEGTV